MSDINQINEKDQIKVVTDEEPIVTIGRSNDNDSKQDGEKIEQITVINVKPPKRWPWVLAAVAALALAAVSGFYGYKYLVARDFELSISVTPQDNIKKLQVAPKRMTSEVVKTTDSILGVELNFYELKGLQASIVNKEPSAWDKDVYFYTRSADYTAEGVPIGTIVQKDSMAIDDVNKRLGYFAAVGRQMVIGISADEDVANYCHDNNGYFFRQFVLVSNSQLPPEFHLHGKVERRALARKEGSDNLFYVEAPNPETMWDFADALREYGFIDAIYITGGSTMSYYRDSKGTLTWIGDNGDKSKGYTHKISNSGYWLVFKRIKHHRKKK